MPTLYLIAGMGLDQRCFSRLLPLLNWAGEVQFLPHLIPEHSREPLKNYVQRLRAQLPAEWNEPPTLMGMSLGGIIAAELAKLIPYQQLFLISTLKQASEVPLYFKILDKIPAHRILPATFSQKYGRKLAKFLGNFEPTHLNTVFDMIEQSDPRHLAWGRNTAINWKAPLTKPQNCFHIHGDKDHIFPARKIQADYWVKGGTHNVILERAEEIAQVINERIY
jgi:pimeloyl-ACP methyl ester carboxylesterase